LSPTHSTLAYDELKEQPDEYQSTIGFEPEIKLIDNMRKVNMTVSSFQVIRIRGKVTVSF
jgi:hypothetical protein